MYLSVRGAKNPDLTRIIKLATNFYANALMSKRLVSKLNIQIFIHDNLKAGGFCFCEDDGRSPKGFTIEIARSKRQLQMIKVLAHEMIHVKQYAKNEMRDTSLKKRSVTYWQGETYYETMYWDRPWEIEAYGLENGLLVKFLAEHQLFKYFKEREQNWIPNNL